MPEKTLTKPEIASQKRVIKLPPALGDWTTYRPPKILVKKVKSGLYGFDRLSKTEVNQVLLIHYRFVERLLQHLKIDLGLALDFLSCQLEQTIYLNFLRGLNEPVVQGKIALATIHETVQLFFNSNLASSVINHALGSRDLEPLTRGLTAAEQVTFTTALEEYLPGYTLAFASTFPNPVYTYLGSPDVTLDQSINPSTTFIVFTADISINEMPQGKIIFGYPGNSIKTLLKAFGEKDKARLLNFSRLPSTLLRNLAARLTATLGQTTLSTAEINQLEIGDVVSLDTPIDAPVLLAIGEQLKVLAQPGLFNKKKAARVAGFDQAEQIELAPPLASAEEKKLATAEAQAAATPEAEQIPATDETAANIDISGEDLLTEEEFGEEELPEEEELTEEEFPAEFEEEEEEKYGS